MPKCNGFSLAKIRFFMKTFGRKPQNVENKMFYDKDEMKKLSAAVKKVWDSAL